MSKHTQLELPFRIDSEVSSLPYTREFKVVGIITGTIYPIEADCPRTALVIAKQRSLKIPLVDAIAVYEDKVLFRSGNWVLWPFGIRP